MRSIEIKGDWKGAKPDFSTFFLNSTAHYQHIYWRHMDPESFEVKPDPAERAIYEDAIPYGYRQMDRMCARFMELAAAAHKAAKRRYSVVRGLPVLATAHDWDTVHQTE